MLQIILTLALGLVGLAAGWLQCTTRVPVANDAEKSDATPAKSKTRLNRTGWVLIAVLGALTLAIGLKANSDADKVEKQQERSASTIRSLNSQLVKANTKIDKLSVVMNEQNDVASWVAEAESLKSKMLVSLNLLPKKLTLSENESDYELNYKVLQGWANVFAEYVENQQSSRSLDRHLRTLQNRIRAYLFFYGSDLSLEKEKVEAEKKRILLLIEAEIAAIEQTLDNLIIQNKPR